MKEEKRDIHYSSARYKTALETLKQDLSETNYNLIFSFLQDLELGIGSTTTPNKTTLLKVLFRLKSIAKYFDAENTALNEITLSQMKSFISKLQSGELKKYSTKRTGKDEYISVQTNEPYSHVVQNQMKKELRRFLKQTLKDKAKYEELCDWFSTGDKRKEIIYYKDHEIKQLIEGASTLKYKTAISVLYDSGLRCGELLNLKYRDIELDQEEKVFCLNIRPEVVKTNKPRKIYLFTEEGNRYLKQYIAKYKEDSSDYIFGLSYGALRVKLRKLGLKVLGKPVQIHALRRSSATKNANRLNQFQLCQRFGWEIGSRVPSLYVETSGIEQKKSLKKIKEEDYKNFKTKIIELEEQNRYLTTEIQSFEEKLESGFYFLIKKLNEVMKGKEKDKIIKAINESEFRLNILPVHS